MDTDKPIEAVTSLSGPIELIDGELTLLIPLSVGGDKLIACSRGIGKVDGEFLWVVLPAWLAEKLKICEGMFVSVDNANGKFNIQPHHQDPDA